MNHTVSLLLAILFSFTASKAQSSLSETEKLAGTARLWGFLKYYHPNVAEGNYDWDRELTTVLPKVKNATSKEELSRVYMEWLDRLGKIKECKGCRPNTSVTYFDKNFDLAWLDKNPAFTAELSESLRYIERNRHQGKKHYVASAKEINNVLITNEAAYSGFDWRDPDLRLLSLFRYWNIIEYFFPYKYQTDKSWDEVLYNMIPKFLHSKTEQEFHLAMLELIVGVDDSHAGFSTDQTRSYFGLYYIPASFKLLDGKAVISGFYSDSLAKKNDLRIGDVITKVNGHEVGAIFREREKYINGSNAAKKRYNSSYAILNGTTDSVWVEYVRDSKTQTKPLRRYLAGELKSKPKGADKYRILDGNIGYINMGVLASGDVAGTMEALKDTRAIILDVRNYPNFILYQMAGYISSRRNDFYKVTYPDLDYPGRFIWKSGDQSGQNGELKYKGKVILLVSEATQSRAEFTVMCLQTGDNVTTIGSQTSGADGNVSIFEMVGGYKTMISGIGIFYPDGTEAQRNGVRIDIEVKPTIQGIKEGRDEILEKAIEFVNASWPSTPKP